jgi:hypothetical protein
MSDNKRSELLDFDDDDVDSIPVVELNLDDINMSLYFCHSRPSIQKKLIPPLFFYRCQEFEKEQEIH